VAVFGRQTLLQIAMLMCFSAIFISRVSAADTTAALNLMTYNIRTGKAQDGLDAWPLRKERTYQIIRKYKPEAIGLQEVMAEQVADLEKAFPGYLIVGTGRMDGRNGNEFSPIMYEASRLHLLRSDTFWLSDTPEVPGSMHWGNKFSRICTWAYFQDRKTGRFFYLFNTHLDHISQPSRRKSIALILDRIRETQPKDPVLLTGDFNSAENNPVIATTLRSGFRDTFRLLHPDEKNVGTTNAFQPGRQENKIDYIFVDDAWQVKSAGIPDDKIDGRWPSDHLPVTATVVLK